MRMLSGALAAEARRSCGTEERQPRMRLRQPSRARALPVLSLVLGALLGTVYVRLVYPLAHPSLYVTGALGGACGLFLLLVVPRLTWLVLYRQWLRFALRFNQARLEQLLARAQGVLKRSTAAQSADSPETLSDLAVVQCLQGDHGAAAAALRQLYEEKASPACVRNLLVVLTEMADWRDVAWLVDRELNEPEGLTDANLARVAARAPYGRLVERLWLVAQDGSLPLTLNNIGVRLLQLGDFMRAEDAFSLINRQYPSYALAHANAGVLAYRRDDFAQAVADTGSAAVLEPGEGMIHCNLGTSLCRTGNLHLARQWLLRARKMLPGSAEVQVNLANVDALEGSYQEALETYSAAARLEESAAAHHNAALMLCARDHPEAAVAEQRLAHAAAPDDREVLHNLGCLLWVQGEYDEARECFRHPSHSAYDTAVKSNLIRIELAADRPRRALDLLLQVSYAEEEMDFDRGLAHLLTVTQAQRPDGKHDPVHERDLVEATAHFDKVVKANRAGTTEAQVNLGISLYLTEDFEDAAEAFAAAAVRAPSHETLGYAVAMCYVTAASRVQRPEEQAYGPLPPRAKELLEKARPHLEAALGVKSVADNVRFNLGVLHYLLEDYARAATVLRPIARIDSPWQILNVLGISQARQARELRRSIQSAVLMTDGRKRQAEVEIGKLLSAAIHSFTQVLRQQPDNVLAHANVGLAQYLRNRGDDVEQALQHWRRMRDIGGEWGRRVFEIFSGAVGSAEAKHLTFQDVEVSFLPLPLEEWIVYAPPRMTGLQFPVLELPDLPPPDLVAHHPVVKRALKHRNRAEKLIRALRRLST